MFNFSPCVGKYPVSSNWGHRPGRKGHSSVPSTLSQREVSINKPEDTHSLPDLPQHSEDTALSHTARLLQTENDHNYKCIYTLIKIKYYQFLQLKLVSNVNIINLTLCWAHIHHVHIHGVSPCIFQQTCYKL